MKNGGECVVDLHIHFSMHGNKCPIGDHILVVPWNYNVSIAHENRWDTHLVAVVGHTRFQCRETRLQGQEDRRSCDTELDGDGPSKVTELNSPGDGLGADEVQDVALLEPSDTLETKAQGLLVDSTNESSLDVQGGALDHVLGGMAEDGLENLGAEEGDSENPESGGEQGDTTCGLLDGVVVHLCTVGSGGTLGSTGSDDQLLDEVRAEQTHHDGKEPEEGRGQTKKE